MKVLVFVLILIIVSARPSNAQKTSFHGQASVVGSFSPKNDLPFFLEQGISPNLGLQLKSIPQKILTYWLQQIYLVPSFFLILKPLILILI